MATASSIEKFVSLRAELVKEKAALESRLARITAALEGVSGAQVPVPAAARVLRGRRRARSVNKMSLKDAVLQATRAKPLSRQEVLAAVQKLGYKFSTDNPLNSLGVVLYDKQLVKNLNGKFSPVK